jgi:hypothetical protein
MSITSLLIAAPGAYAGKPDPDAGIPVLGTVIESPDHIYPWEMQRVNATERAEDGSATRAFNSYKMTSVVPISMRFGTISTPIISIGAVPGPGTGWR